MMCCVMCGYEFDAAELNCHRACPLARGCLVICCPRCGYSTVDPARTRLARWVAWLGRPEPVAAPPPAGVPLLSLRPGQEATVVAVATAHLDRARQLSQYGLAPGTQIRLLQKRPTPIIQVGQTDLALDLPVAAEIYVAK
jgi:Fe2+ transport system protein FeoA